MIHEASAGSTDACLKQDTREVRDRQEQGSHLTQVPLLPLVRRQFATSRQTFIDNAGDHSILSSWSVSRTQHQSPARDWA